MITAVRTAQKLDWQGWLLGIMRAVITGAAGAAASYLGVSTSGLGASSKAAWHVVWITMLVTSGAHLAIYLQTHPVPDAVVVQTDPSQGNVSVSVSKDASVKVTQEQPKT